MWILSGDVGGTKTLLSLCDSEKKVIQKKRYTTSSFKSLEEIITIFLGNKLRFDKACFGIAGPIKDGVCNLTNINWIIDLEKMKKEFNLNDLFLINDLEANAWGIQTLSDEDLFVLQRGAFSYGNQVVISAGTGLGLSGIVNNVPFPSEGGHSTFAPLNHEQSELFFFLKEKFDHVSCERVVSGMGIENIFSFFVDGKKMNSIIPRSAEAISKSIDHCLVCQKTIDLFLDLYGSFCGNAALHFLATRGVFIGGGIAPKLLNQMQNGKFMNAFTEKGRMKSLLSTIPVYVVLNEETALFGADLYARTH